MNCLTTWSLSTITLTPENRLNAAVLCGFETAIVLVLLCIYYSHLFDVKGHLELGSGIPAQSSFKVSFD